MPSDYRVRALNKDQLPKPGIYIITRDVENPRGDKRVRREFKRDPVWPKGTRLIVKEWSTSDPDCTRLEAYPLGRYSTDGFMLDYYERTGEAERAQVDALLAPGVLELEPPSLESALAIRGDLRRYDVLLDRLIAMGKITIADVLAAIDGNEAES